jgi:single-stranded DNA-binding protein
MSTSPTTQKPQTKGKTKFHNEVLLTVRVGTEPEARTSKSGNLWAKARVSLSMGKNEDGSYKPSAWLTAKAFTHEGDASLPEALGALKKGDYVTLTGRLAYEEYETTAGEKRSDYSIIVSKIERVQADEADEAEAAVADDEAESDFNPPA